jgi:hypothetical protein
MKLNENFILKTIAGSPVVVPVGDAVKTINGMITLNGPAEVIWQGLEKGENCAEILSTLKAKYDAPEELLKSDLETFLGKLKRLGILEE